jgi:2-keto-4-pentenoate hydratase/2-oxohepta-3-ene-1,7-dioic acid hydratase in catechol pathway
MSWSRLIRFVDEEGQTHYGEPLDDTLTKAKVLEGDLFGSNSVSDRVVVVKKLLAPIVTGEIIGIGVNFKRTAALLNLQLPENPIVFRKGQGTIQNPNDPIVVPKVAKDPPEVDFEVELAVIIGRNCKNVSVEKALDYVLGYTVANDVSARLWHGKRAGGGQITHGKCFDTFFPFGPVIVHPRLVPDPQNLTLKTWLNGKLMQDSNTSDMNFGAAKLISFLSQGTTLLPGTVISTGTPEGVGSSQNPQVFLKAGDTVVCEVGGVSKISNPVIDETF